MLLFEETGTDGAMVCAQELAAGGPRPRYGPGSPALPVGFISVAAHAAPSS